PHPCGHGGSGVRSGTGDTDRRDPGSASRGRVPRSAPGRSAWPGAADAGRTHGRCRPGAPRGVRAFVPVPGVPVRLAGSAPGHRRGGSCRHGGGHRPALAARYSTGGAGSMVAVRGGGPCPARHGGFGGSAAAVARLRSRQRVNRSVGRGCDLADQVCAGCQEWEGTRRIEGSRTYYDQSLYWVGWCVGLGTILFASLGAALVMWRLALRRSPQWLRPAMLLTWTVITTL